MARLAPDESAVSLTSAVLDEDAARLAAQADAAESRVLDDDQLPGVGDAGMSLRQGVNVGGLALLARESADGKSSGNSAMGTACTALQIFVAGAKAAGPNLTPETWGKAVEDLGKIELPAMPTGSFGPNKPDAQDLFQLEANDPKWKLGASTNEFTPVGSPITIDH